MAAGIIEKGNSGLFNNEVEFNGKYATMIRFLKEDVGIFGTFREAYVVSAIMGFLNDRQMTEDKTAKVQAASIFAAELSKRKPDLRFIYRLIMLLKEEEGYSIDDYKNRTFRDDPEDNAETLKQNMEIFNSYACGGLEYLYEKFENCTKIEDTVEVMYDLVHQISVSFSLCEEEDELPEFTPEFA